MEPRRLLEENPTDIERALLNVGAAYRCSPSSRAKTLAALGIAGSAALSAGVGVSTASVVAKFGWTKIFMAVAALGAATAVPVGYYAWKRAHLPQAHVALARAPENVAPMPALTEVQKDVPQAQPSAAMPDESNVKVLPAAKYEPKADTSAALSDELAVLDAARATLSRGDSTGALARLDNYNRSFPKGRLQLEAEVLRIDATRSKKSKTKGKRLMVTDSTDR